MRRRRAAAAASPRGGATSPIAEIAVVTGGAGGIGRWIARGLACAGFHTVILGRTATRGEAARAWISAEVPGARVDVLTVDLASRAATEAVAARLLAAHPRIGVLVNNAGIFLPRRVQTGEGREAVLAVNHLAPFVLTRALRPALAAGRARVVNVGSSTSDRARIDPDDLEFSRRRWGMVRAYSQSKLALMMASFEWARRLRGEGITVNVVHPGMVATSLVRAGGPIGFVWRHILGPLVLTEAQGADTPLHAALDPGLAAMTGAYLKSRRPVSPNRRALDPALVARVWQATERLAGPA